MKVMVLGCGLMGPAAAYNLATGTEVKEVMITDIDAARLASAEDRLDKLGYGGKCRGQLLNILDQKSAVDSMQNFDVILGALPQSLHIQGIEAAVAAGTPMVDIAYFNHPQWPDLKKKVDASGVLIIPGCGVEPGLTEIIARHLGDKLDTAEELHIKVGGIPENPKPPLNYKIVFGGHLMPWEDTPARILMNGELTTVPRYSEIEMIDIPGVGVCEAWHENFFSWMLEVASLKNLKTATQKTFRWPGYAERAAMLMELGLLNRNPIEVDGVEVIPKRLVDEVLAPHVRLEEGERDITVFRVEVLGRKKDRPRRYLVDMVDRYDSLGFTSMARTTAMTGAIVARMVGRGEIRQSGLKAPEQVIFGDLFKRLIKDLAEMDIRFRYTIEKQKSLEE